MEEIDKKKMNDKREEFSVEIRSGLRKNILTRKRNKFLSDDKDQMEQEDNQLDQKEQNLQNSITQNLQFEKVEQKLEEIQKICENIHQNKNVRDNMTVLRFLTQECDDSGDIIDQLIYENDVIPQFLITLEQLGFEDQMKTDILTILTNCTYGTPRQNDKLFALKLHQSLMKNYDSVMELYLQKKTNDQRPLQIILVGICNLLESKLVFKQYFQKENLFQKLSQLLENIAIEDKTVQLIKYAAQALIYLTDLSNQYSSDLFSLKPIQCFINLFLKINDKDLQIDLIWTTVHLVQIFIKSNQKVDNSESLNFLIDINVYDFIKKAIASPHTEIIEASLNIIVSLLYGNTEQKQKIMEDLLAKGILGTLSQLLDHQDRSLRLMSVKVIDQMSKMEGVVKQAYIFNFVPKLLNRVEQQDDSTIKRECIKIIYQLVNGAANDDTDRYNYILQNFQLQQLLMTCLKDSMDLDLLKYSLRLILRSLPADYMSNETEMLKMRAMKMEMDEVNLQPVLEKLTQHQNSDIYKPASKILDALSEYEAYEQQGQSMQQE